MIKVERLNKHFNKGKPNEIHVINNTTLEFPQKGLVTLLGNSGSGKTTLLNVIGGLDKTTGTITFKDERISYYNSKVWDKLRVNNIGYIFQNYYLIEDKTVSDNIKLVLTMMGINDNEEIEYRVKYVLEAVGMYRFRNKLASDLSGGQKQRVAIARAIVKNPDVVIADEPTGNLDSNNSIEVLKIIKEISKDKLVILVTHNIDLANFYSDRIIKISDGKVVEDILNSGGKQNLQYVDNNIYLKDLNNITNNNIKIYSNEDLSDVNLTIVKIDNNYYLKTTEKNITVKVVSDSSEVKFIDKQKTEVLETFTKETSFNLEQLEANAKPRTKSKVYSLKDSFIEAFKKLANLSRKGKIQILALIYLGMMFTTSFLLLTSSIFIDTSKINHDKNHYILKIDRDVADTTEYTDDHIIYPSYDVIFYNGPHSANMQLKVYPKEAIHMENTNPEFVYIDESVLNNDYAFKYLFSAFGITKKEHFINQKVKLSYLDKNFVIKGTVKTNNYAIYVDKEILKSGLIKNFSGIDLYYEELQLNNTLTPSLTTGEYEIYLSEKMHGLDLESEVLNWWGNDIGFKIVGFYIDNSPRDENYKIYIKEESFKSFVINNVYYELEMYSLSGDNVPSNVISSYDNQYNEMKEVRNLSLASGIGQSLTALAITVLIFYFLVRSSITKRRKEISILRSLGISNNEVKRLFAVEYFILTTTTSLIGVFIGAYTSKLTSQSFLQDFFNIRVNAFTLLLTIITLYLVNILVALIPITKMLKKTPADLLTQYDI